MLIPVLALGALDTMPPTLMEALPSNQPEPEGSADSSTETDESSLYSRMYVLALLAVIVVGMSIGSAIVLALR